MTLMIDRGESQGAWPEGSSNGGTTLWGNEEGWPTRRIPPEMFKVAGSAALSQAEETPPKDARMEVDLPGYYPG